MKRLLTVLVALIVVTCPRSGHAGRIEGKWGLSAPVSFAPGEFSLIRGTSTGAWILDARFDASRRNEEAVPPTPFDAQVSIDETGWEIGPRWRRYSRPGAEFSPYVDVFAHGHYQRTAVAASVAPPSTGGGTTLFRTYGLSGGLALGVELFTKWGLSTAVSSQIVQVNWWGTHNTAEGGGIRYDRDGYALVAGLQFTPRVYVRGYW